MCRFGSRSITHDTPDSTPYNCQSLLTCLICAFWVSIASCGTDAEVNAPPPDGRATPPSQAVVVDAAGGTIDLPIPSGSKSLVERVRLTVPAHALANETTLQITATQLKPMPGVEGVPLFAVEIEPSGTQFEEPVELSFRYEAAEIPGDMIVAEGGLEAVWYDPSSGVWVPLPGSKWNPASSTVTASIEHLSTYGVFAPTLTLATPAAVASTGDPESYNSRHPPVLLVHGIQLTQGPTGLDLAGADTFGRLPALLGCGPDPLEVFEFTYNSWWGVENGAYWLGWAVGTIRELPPVKASGHETVSLVTHSMGGLVARAYLEGLSCQELDGCPGVAEAARPTPNHVERLITLATPHSGVDLAERAFCWVEIRGEAWGHKLLDGLNVTDVIGAQFLSPACRDLGSGSDFLDKLNTPRHPLVPDLEGTGGNFHILWGSHDWIVEDEEFEGSLRVALGIPHDWANPGECDSLGICEYAPFSASHTGSSGIANVDDSTHPAYSLVCEALGRDGCDADSACFLAAELSDSGVLSTDRLLPALTVTSPAGNCPTLDDETQATLAWRVASTTGIDSFLVDVRPTSGCGAALIDATASVADFPLTVPPTLEATVTVAELQAGTWYAYQIVSRAQEGYVPTLREGRFRTAAKLVDLPPSFTGEELAASVTFPMSVGECQEFCGWAGGSEGRRKPLCHHQRTKYPKTRSCPGLEARRVVKTSCWMS